MHTIIEYLLTLTSSFYRPSAYALAQVVVDMPLVAVQVIIFDLIVYLCVYNILSWHELN
jgi:hypothetical protein